MVALNSRKRSVPDPMDDIHEDYPDAAPGIADSSPDSVETVENPPATETEPDEYDIAAEVIDEAPMDTEAEAAAAGQMETSDGATLAQDTLEPSADPDEDRNKTPEEIAQEALRNNTGASPEEARNAVANAQAQDAARQPPLQPGGAGSALINGLGGAVGAGFDLAKRVANSAIRGAGISRTAGLTPEVVKNRLFKRWHHDYEGGVRTMERSMTDLVKSSAAFNQLVRTSAPGRELEAIAKSKGTDLQTLLGEVAAGKSQDAKANAAAEKLRMDPNIQKQWSEVERNSQNYEEGLERVKHNMTQLMKNNAGVINPDIEKARLEDIHGKASKVEQPLELPPNPIGEKNADGTSKQKSMWEQFKEMSQHGLDFLQDLFNRVVNFVSSKFGR